MGVLTDSISHSYNGEEFLTEIFYKPQHDGSGQNPFELYRVMDNVKGKRNLYKVAALQKVLREDTGCGFSAVGSAAISDKVIDPKRIRLNLEQCEADFKDEVFAHASKNGIARDDIRGTTLDTIIQTQMVKAIQEDLVKLAWFGDDSDTDAFYGISEGYWAQILAGGFGGYTLDLNSSATFESAGVLATDGALAAIRNLYENQPAAMRAVPTNEKKIFVTSTVFDNLQNTMEQTGADSGLNRISEGGALRFRGMDVVDMSLFDVSLGEVAATNASNATGSNAIVMTLPENLVVATDISEPTAMTVWYEEKDEKVYYKSKFLFASSIIHDELVTAAY